MGGQRKGFATFAAALIALLMLSYASVQSTVMQVAMTASAEPLCGGGAMTGMAAWPGKFVASKSKPGHAPAKTCPYCAAAAHLPIVGTATPWRAPCAFTFAAFRVVASHGPRGPPRLQPRARGPPADLLTL